MKPEQINKVISEWKGECRHPEKYRGMICSKCGANEEVSGGITVCPDAPDYTTDYSAWDDEMFALIEEKGLWSEFATELKEITIGHRIASLTSRHAFRLSKASPLAKATALAMAITEGKG